MSGINWYPGHMAKTRRAIEAVLPQVDVVAEITDARIPASSRNPDLAALTASKPHILILNKCDLADPVQNRKWVEFYRAQGHEALLFDCKNKKAASPADFRAEVRRVFSEKSVRLAARGIRSRVVRLMVIGVPNVGKSTFINFVCGSAKTRAEDRPGVTRSLQWVPVADGIDLLDVPGMLWGKLEDADAAEKLAITGAVNDLAVDTEALGCRLLARLRTAYPKNLCERYRLTEIPQEADDYELMQLIGKKRGFVVSGGEVDTERTALMLLDEFRGGKMGRITLDVL